MTSKERVQTAFAHKHPDKVPVDFGGMNCSMINAVVLNELRNYYGLEYRPPKINDMSTMTAYVEPDWKNIWAVMYSSCIIMEIPMDILILSGKNGHIMASPS